MTSYIKSITKGFIHPLKEVNDPTFAEEMLGKGFAMTPDIGSVYAPFDGEVTSVFPTKHAVTLRGENGLEVLIHIGLDTVNLKGEHFTAHVTDGQKVQIGDLLVEFDLEAIKAKGYDTIIPTVIVNSNDYDSIELILEGPVEKSQPVLKVSEQKVAASDTPTDSSKKLEDEIMMALGGEENIQTMTHCATRLRVTPKDKSKVNTKKIESLKGVLGVTESMGGLQIIIGNQVSEVYKKINHSYQINSGNDGDKVKAEKEPRSIKGFFNRLLNALSAIVGPVIPIIMVSGLIQALIVILRQFGISDENSTMMILDTVANVSFYFLPIFLAYTSALRFKTSPILALFFGGLLLHPGILGLVDIAEGVNFLGIPITAVDYSSSFLPPIFTVLILSHVEKFAAKVVPEALNFVFKPLLIVLIMIPVTLIITGPIGAVIGNVLAQLILLLNENATWLPVLLVSSLAPLLVLTGTHIALIPLVISSFETYGFDNFLFPAFIGINFSQFAVALAVTFKSKNSNLRQLGISSAITAFLSGVTEPALYGISIRLKRPLIATFIGCIANGIFCAIVQLKVFAFSAPSFLTLPIFLNPDGTYTNFILALVAVAITIIVTFAATWIFGFDDSIYEDKKLEEAKV